MSEKTTGTVVYKADASHQSKLTLEQQERLSSLRDEDIDFSDATPTPRGSRWYRPGTLHSSDSVRLDADVLAFFRKEAMPDGSRVNDVLRTYIEAQRKAS